MTATTKPKQDPTWRPPTRRLFVQMLAAAAATIALKDQHEKPALPLWIGHC